MNYLSLIVLLCISAASASGQVGKWVNLSLSPQSEFLIFDFEREEITTLDDQKFKFKMNGDQLVIFLSGKALKHPVTTVVSRDTILIRFKGQSPDNNSLLLVRKESFFEKRIFDKNVLMGEVFQRYSSHDSGKSFIELYSNFGLIETSISQADTDTISNFAYFNFIVRDSISVIKYKGPVANMYFLITKWNSDSIHVVSRSYHFTSSEVWVKKSIEFNMVDLIGQWFHEGKYGGSLSTAPDFKRIQIFEDRVSIIDTYGDVEMIPFSFNKFGSLMILDGHKYKYFKVVLLDDKLIRLNYDGGFGTFYFRRND